MLLEDQGKEKCAPVPGPLESLMGEKITSRRIALTFPGGLHGPWEAKFPENMSSNRYWHEGSTLVVCDVLALFSALLRSFAPFCRLAFADLLLHCFARFCAHSRVFCERPRSERPRSGISEKSACSWNMNFDCRYFRNQTSLN